jgi:hypothetical protein
MEKSNVSGLISPSIYITDSTANQIYEIESYEDVHTKIYISYFINHLLYISNYEPYFIDWQYICEGKGIQDIIFFMIESFNKESMAAYFYLFKEYYYVKLLEY